MGVPSEGKSPTIQSLWPHHRSMARALVAAGLTPSQLADAYGFSKGQITRIINSPMFKLEMSRIEEKAEEIACDIREDIKKLAVRAVEVLDDQLNKVGIPENVKQRAAFDVLDRAGYGAKEKPSGGNSLHLTQINVGKLSDKELKDEVMDLIEGEWKEEDV